MPRKYQRTSGEQTELPENENAEHDLATASRFAPLAERMRPRTLEEVAGQSKLLGPGKPLRAMAERGKLYSMVLWGPPGTGKTTIARLMASQVAAPFFAVSAVSSSVKELREIFEQAETENKESKERSVLFVDEIHRFSKSQQDALLGAVERGLVTIIGATTENPSFEVISPLLSRTRVFVLEPLSVEDLAKILEHALRDDVELREKKIEIGEEARRTLFALSGGDARRLLGALELAVEIAGDKTSIELRPEDIEQAVGRKASRYDKAGEEHYNIISAFIKSMRGSDPDASLYWLARMIEAGEDLEFIVRRMIIFASEDIGNADPNALLLAVACWEAVRAVGWPESQIMLGHVVTYLAAAQKSNRSYKGIGAAMEEVAKNPNAPVPLHLRNAPTKLMKDLGYHAGYKYAHSFEGNFTRAITYLPDEHVSSVYYQPSENGRERIIAERLRGLWPERYGPEESKAEKSGRDKK